MRGLNLRRPHLQSVMLLLALPLGSSNISAGIYADAVKALALEELAATVSDRQLRSVLGRAGRKLPKADQQAAAVLVQLGAITRADLRYSPRDKLARFTRVLGSEHPGLIGRLHHAALDPALTAPLDHTPLLANDAFLAALGQLLEDGVLTGYDLRLKDVYRDLPQGLSFVYSHASQRHLRQLVALLAQEQVNGWLYVTPKVSAFLFRDEWGEPGDQVVALASGLRVVQGREMAIAFQFDTPEDRDRFHELVQRFAKKDTEDEPGLIADAWWQPFYYSDAPVPAFEEIALILVAQGDLEATLTVLKARQAQVLEALRAKGWQPRVDTVWVNPSFFRFLHGGFR
jgi:hypothetical protein